MLQHVNSNYEIDLFQSLLNAAADAIGCANEGQASLKVVADHIRSCGFLIADGVTPSTKAVATCCAASFAAPAAMATSSAPGQLLPSHRRRAGRGDGRRLPELKQQQAHIERVLKNEEEQFAKTTEQGLKIWSRIWPRLPVASFPARWCSSFTTLTASRSI